MHYIVDAYNLLHAAAGMGGPLSGATVRLICQYISASAASFKVSLILDGRAKPDEPSENEFPDIHLIYSGAGIKADTVIAQIVERAKSRKKITVVSNDRAVVLHARTHFASAISCDTFITQLLRQNSRAADHHALRTQKTTGTPTSGESEHWMKEFGLDVPPAQGNPPPAPQKKLTGDPDRDDLDMDIEGLLGPRGP